MKKLTRENKFKEKKIDGNLKLAAFVFSVLGFTVYNAGTRIFRIIENIINNDSSYIAASNTLYLPMDVFAITLLTYVGTKTLKDYTERLRETERENIELTRRLKNRY